MSDLLLAYRVAMRKYVTKKNLLAAGLGALCALHFLYPADAMEAARAACRLWAQNVMPALFPYMVLSTLLITALPGGRHAVVPLSMLGGSPAGARLIALAAPQSGKRQALAALCATASPLYIIGTLKGGPIMLLSHLLSAVALFFAVSLLPQKAVSGAQAKAPVAPTRPSFADIVRDATLTSLTICGYMALFMVVSALIARALPLPGVLRVLLLCFLEMAGGCSAILSLGLSHQQTMPLLCAAVSFGGLSIFMQNASFLKPAGVHMKTQFIAKLVHALLSYLFYVALAGMVR